MIRHYILDIHSFNPSRRTLCGQKTELFGNALIIVVDRKLFSRKEVHEQINCLACKLLSFQIKTNIVDDIYPYTDNKYERLTEELFKELIGESNNEEDQGTT